MTFGGGRAILPAAGFQPAWPPERRLRPGLAALQLVFDGAHSYDT